jgi:hypothetical protein
MDLAFVSSVIKQFAPAVAQKLLPALQTKKTVSQEDLTIIFMGILVQQVMDNGAAIEAVRKEQMGMQGLMRKTCDGIAVLLDRTSNVQRLP